jgi:hypothetical protein
MPLHRKLRRVSTLALLAAIFAATGSVDGSRPASASSNEGQQIGKILSVQKVLRNQYFISRYPQIHYYMIYISLRISDRTYCAEYETPVLDEIDDVSSANGKDVEVVLKDKKIIVRTPKGRKLKAHLVAAKRC